VRSGPRGTVGPTPEEKDGARGDRCNRQHDSGNRHDRHTLAGTVSLGIDSAAGKGLLSTRRRGGRRSGRRRRGLNSSRDSCDLGLNTGRGDHCGSRLGGLAGTARA
jgi:hypothetical protein